MSRYFSFLSAVAGVVLACCAIASAAEFDVGNVQIINPWTRATPKGAQVAGAYMTIRNKGSEPDRFMGGSSDVASHVEVHKMEMEGGVAKMRPVEGGLEIKPGDSIELKPGSFHVMFVDLKEPIKEGDRLKGTLEFEKAGKIEVDYVAVAVGASPGGHKPEQGASDGHNH